MLYNKKKKFHFLFAHIWKPRMSKSDPEPANALYLPDSIFRYRECLENRKNDGHICIACYQGVWLHQRGVDARQQVRIWIFFTYVQLVCYPRAEGPQHYDTTR